MPSPTEITVSQLSRLIGLPTAPAIVDVRDEDDFAADPRLIPGSRHHDYRNAAAWAERYADTAKLPASDAAGRSVWVTRARPKIDRIACPWLIRRFIDPDAVFLFVAPSEVPAVAERFGAAAFDIENTFWSHRGEKCTFDTMVEEFGLDSETLGQVSRIVRGADTSRLELAPESAGLLAASLGFSRMYKDDLAQLEASMALYDAIYRWCRDAQEETHNWPSTKTGA